MENRKKVSIIVPVYNHERYIGNAIESVINQTYPNFELILVNDGSTDGSLDVCERYAKKDSRIQIISQRNQGRSRARNTGICRASGEYMGLLDSDDMMKHRKIELQLQILQNKNVDVVYSSVDVIDDRGAYLTTVKCDPVDPANFLSLLFFRNLCPTASALLGKRSCFQDDLFDDRYSCDEDYEWLLRAAHKHAFYCIEEPLVLYRRHETNISEDLEALRRAELRILNQYGSAHLLNVVDQTLLDKDDKHLLKGKLLCMMEQFGEAETYLNALDSSLSHFYLGNCKLYTDQFSQAAVHYRIAIQHDPLNAAACNNLGAAYLQLSQNEKARMCFEQALALKPGYLDPEKNLQSRGEELFITRRELRSTLLPYKK